MQYKKLLDYIKDRDYRFRVNAAHGSYNSMSDELYLKKMFKARMGYELDLEHPRTYNEKIQWLKLYDRNPLYVRLVDKYEVKKYISDLLGEQYVVPSYGVWDSFDEIDFSSLPDQFVLKCTHDSYSTIVCRDKKSLDIPAAKKKIDKALKRNYYYVSREWPYKNVKPRVLAEKYITDAPGSNELTDYKFYCFDGKVDCVLVCCDRAIGAPKFYFFDQDWNLKRYNRRGKEAPEGFTLPKPQGIDEMFEIAGKLCSGFPSVRVDLYQSCGQIYFGELTFYPYGGFDNNRLPEADLYFGDLIHLEKVEKRQTDR